MSEQSSKLSVTQIIIIACVIWVIGLGGGLYKRLGTYSIPTAQDIRSSNDELVKVLEPSIAFQCYRSDESKMGTNLECEDKILLTRDRMIFVMESMQIFLLAFFTIPLVFWILYMAAPKLFFFIPSRKED